MRTGLADHFGWAVAVTCDGTKVVDRRRLELVEPELPAAPIHYEKDLDDAASAALVERVRASVRRCADRAFDELPAGITSISLRALPERFPTDIATLRQPPWEARADAVMYREVLVEVAEARGWDVHFYDAKHVLAALPGDVLDRPRAELGPPWTKDHRVAMAAAILADGA